MTIPIQERAEEVVAGWRRADQIDGCVNPAGPLFAGGKYAEHELAMTHQSINPGGCGTGCTYSVVKTVRRDCC